MLEVKPWDSALVDGSCMPRLKVNGKPATTSSGVLSQLTGIQDEIHNEIMPALIPRHGSQRARQPPLTAIFLLPMKHSRLRKLVHPESGPWTRLPNPIGRQQRCITGRLRAVPTSGRGALGRPRTSETEHQKAAIFKLGDIS